MIDDFIRVSEKQLQRRINLELAPKGCRLVKPRGKAIRTMGRYCIVEVAAHGTQPEPIRTFVDIEALARGHRLMSSFEILESRTEQ
ncbi:MAG: hypothetical protein JSS28_06310 [Proteobacteria bacterium]|nr:hypothetical protein [Pseudomonadota bacterium]